MVFVAAGFLVSVPARGQEADTPFWDFILGKFAEVWNAIAGINNRINGVKPLHLFDANGQDLGILIDASSYDDLMYRSFLPNQGVVIQVLDRIQFRSLELRSRGIASGIFFTGSNCTGNAYTRISYIGPSAITGITGPRYFKGTTDSGGINTTLSYFDGTRCQNTSPETTMTYLLNEITLPFTEPLAWPLSIKVR